MDLSVFLLNTTVVYLRLTVVVSCHTQRLGPRFRSTLLQGPGHLGLEEDVVSREQSAERQQGGDEHIGGGNCREGLH